MHSLAKKILISVCVVFLIVLLVQAFVITQYFDVIYMQSILNLHQNELRSVANNYRAGTEFGYDSSIRDYEERTGSSVLVVTEDYQLGDSQFMACLRTISLSLGNSGNIYMPTLSYEDYPNRPNFFKNQAIQISAVQIGNSSYYEPLIISIGDTCYTNLDGVHNYINTDAPIENLTVLSDRGIVSPFQENPLTSYKNEAANRFLYKQILSRLIHKTPISELLEDMTGRVFSTNQSNYAIYSENKIIDGHIYYFFTARQLVSSGLEQIHFKRIFFSLYALLGCIMLFAAWGFSRYLTKPLTQLNKITQQYAKMDFSQSADIKQNDEMGMLSDSINIMASNLSNAFVQLQEANDLARKNETRMKELLVDLAHEFNTPLFIISSYTEALEKGISGPSAEKYFSLMNSEIDSLSKMVSEVIELSNIQMGTWKIDIQPWDIEDIMKTTLEKFENRFKEGNYSVTWSVPDVTVLMDARRIEQVLTNFLSNAIKYSLPKKIITIHASIQEGKLYIYIGNSGKLDNSAWGEIWDRYYKGRNEQLTRLPSKGVGLDIVKTILSAHNSHFGTRQDDDMLYFFFSLELYKSESGEF